jgi:hypothetical protein
MATGLPTEARSERNTTVEEKVTRFRQLFADAPQYAKTAVENVLDELKSQVEAKPLRRGWRARAPRPTVGRASAALRRRTTS